MLFNSYTFIFVFVPILLLMFRLIRRRSYNAHLIALSLGSLTFYSWWNPAFLPLILFSIIGNYLAGLLISNLNNHMTKKLLLTIGVIANLGVLGYFKYTSFLIENLNVFASTPIEPVTIVLPLAISFFTFQQIMFLVDCRHARYKRINFFEYSTFVSFFPQLIAGPIVSYAHMRSELPKIWNCPSNTRYDNSLFGLQLFSLGLFKKVCIADTFALWANNGYEHTSILDFFEAWFTSLAYTFQLYFDFSGYADMAIGLGLLFNVRLPINFNSPYKATSIKDFWDRWHMTLSQFFRHHVYNPVTKKSNSFRVRLCAVLVTFFLTGLWHGASWLFVLWGVYHGIGTIIHRMWRLIGITLHPVVAWFITFNFINVGWVFFRAETLEDALHVLTAMAALGSVTLPYFTMHVLGPLDITFLNFSESQWLGRLGDNREILIYTVAAFLIVTTQKNSSQLVHDLPKIVVTMFACVLFLFALGELNGFSEFLYFNF